MKKSKWLDKFDNGISLQENPNNSVVKLPPNYVGLGYDTSSRKFSPAWGGQFQRGGKLTPVSPLQQVQQAVQPTPTVPYLQTKDPREFYKSWIQSPEYEQRLKSTGYSDVPDRWNPDKLSEIQRTKIQRLNLLENIQPLEYDRFKRSEASPFDIGGPTININPLDYEGSSRQSIEAHEIAHVGTPTMSYEESEIIRNAMLPMKEPVLSGAQGSKENKTSITALEDFQHSKKPDEAKADLDALRFMMYDKGIYDITKGKKFTETDFEKAKQNLGKDRVFKRLTDRMGKKNFVKLMNTIASADTQEEVPIAMGGMSIPGSVGFSYARVAGSAPSKGKYAKKTMASAQKGKQVQKGVDSTLENIFEIFDPTGASSWDDVYQSYQKSGMSPETKLEILGALPILGKVGKVGKLLGPALSAGQANKRIKTNANVVSNVMQSIPYIGRGTDATQAVQQFSDVPFFPTAPPAGVGQFGRYAGMPSMNLEKKQYGGEIPSAQNGIMSPMLLARNVLNYFYPSEEASSAVTAAPVEYKKGLTDELLKRQAYKESTFNPAAVSPAGYKGLTQIGEEVLTDYSKKKGGKKLDPFNPKDAVELQKFAMGDLYNASFINKSDQPDSVRIAKTLAAYNWGRGNLFNYLNEQKQKGVDIYDSYDWLNDLPKETSDYVNKILLQEDQSFNRNYKKDSTNPKYKDITSLYGSKEFGGNIPSAQNGQEMRFYQNGLDWKPKSMQNGGEEMYQGLELPEFVVEGKDERMKEAMSQGINKFYAHVGELMGAPQKEMMQRVTGKEQTPSEAWGFQDTGGWLDSYSSFGKNLLNTGLDLGLDPVNAIPGIGLVDDLTKGAVRAAAQNVVSKPLQRGLSPWGYEFENIARIPQNLIRNIDGKSKKFSSAVQRNINEGRGQFILQGLKNREDAWSTYLGLDRDFNTMKLVGSDDVTGLSKYEYTNPIVFEKASPRPNPKAGAQSQRMARGLYDVSEGRLYNKKILNNDYGDFAKLDLNVPGSSTVGNDKLFGTMGGFQKYVSPDGKNLMYRDIWDLQPFSRLTSDQLPRDVVGNAIRNFEVSSIIPGAKPFVAQGKLGDIKTKFLQAELYKNIAKRYGELKRQGFSTTDIKTLLSEEKSFLNPVPLEESIKYVDTNPYTKFGNSKPDLSGFDFTPSRPEKFLQKIQDAANQPVSKFEIGGVIKDDRGQWAYPGEVTEINSNYITMEGVPYDVLGVSNTGDTKLMKPGKNYKFKGKKVTEYPMAQYGKGVPFRSAENPTKNISNPLNLPSALVPNIKPKASFEEQKRIAKLELDKYGYTSDQRKGYVKGRSEKAFRNITPQDYGDLTKTLDRIERYEKDLGRNPNETVWYGAEDSSTGKPIYYDLPKRDDAFALYLGLPQKNKSFGISEYQPGDSKENKYYYKPNYLDENLKNRLLASYFGNVDDDSNVYIANERGDAFPQKTDSLERAGVPFENPMYAEWMADNPLGDFKMSKGKDKKGHYISIYDEWDLNPFKKGEGSSSNPAAATLKAFAKIKGVDVGDETEMSNLFGAGKPFEIYDRIYYDPKTKKVIPQKRNGGGVGINQLDAQPMKKLNQLLNFTNNPDKDNWLDKYN